MNQQQELERELEELNKICMELEGDNVKKESNYYHNVPRYSFQEQQDIKDLKLKHGDLIQLTERDLSKKKEVWWAFDKDNRGYRGATELEALKALINKQ